eukprot:6626502-Prymnesium_polylepis.1
MRQGQDQSVARHRRVIGFLAVCRAPAFCIHSVPQPVPQACCMLVHGDWITGSRLPWFQGFQGGGGHGTMDRIR